MATYIELYTALNHVDNDGLKSQVGSAVIIAAEEKISDLGATAAQLAWADDVLLNPRPVAKKALLAVMAANKDVSISAMQSATDIAVQAKVDAIVPGLISAHGV